jgi:transposase InsO family protein
MSRPRWPDSPNSLSENPGTVHEGPAQPDTLHAGRQPDLGGTAYSRRVAEARVRRLASHRGHVPASASDATIADLADVPGESRVSNRVDRLHRLWRQAGLQVPRRRPRRRVGDGPATAPLPAATANHIWAYDFVFDTCANGQTLKCLTVVDEFTRECLAIDVAGGIRSARVLEVLARLVSVHGAVPTVNFERVDLVALTAMPLSLLKSRTC